MKTKIFLFVLIAVNFYFAQQTSEQMAFPGPNGIFIVTGLDIPFSASGKSKPFSYKIERSQINQNKWTVVTQLSAPENYESFINTIYKLNRLLKDSIPANELPLDNIWKKAKQYERLDSLKYLGNPLIVRMALGVTYLDKDISENQSYVYKVSKLDRDGNVIESFTTNSVSYPGKFQNNPLTIFTKETSDNFIRLTWKAAAAYSPARFKTFRRENFLNDFTLVNPIIMYNSNENEIAITILDSAISPNSTYEYYLLPLDYYQNDGIASDTVTVAAFSFNKIFPPYNITVSAADSIGGLKLSWAFDFKDAITSIKIFRSIYSDKEFEEIAEVTGFDTIYVDRTAEPMIKYFYYFLLNDQFGEVPLQSAKVFGLYKSDEVPPPPYNIHPDSTETGIKLVWNKPDEYVNTYHIYRNLGDDQILSELKIIQSSDSLVEFLDTSSTLKGNRIYYYAVKAENTSGNISDFSDTVQVFPKIKVTINSPKQLKGYYLEGKVFLYWENLFEVDETIEGYKVYRRTLTDNNAEFTLLLDSLLSPKQNNFVDTSVIEGSDYEYAVKAFDIFGNESDYSSSIKINVPETPIIPPTGLTLFNRDEGILIGWGSPESEKISKVKIFRYERGLDPVQIGMVSSADLQYVDKSAVKGKLYFYFIRFVDNNGFESVSSEELGIRRE